jgi:hypothetical protein
MATGREPDRVIAERSTRFFCVLSGSHVLTARSDAWLKTAFFMRLG